MAEVIKMANRGMRGESFADVARRRGSINGRAIAPTDSDQVVLDAFGDAAGAVVDGKIADATVVLDGKVADASGAAASAAAAVGSVSKALVLEIDPSIPVTSSATWKVDAGRWRRELAGWVRGFTNEERIYTDSNGVIQGVLVEDAETYHSAPFHNVVPGSGAAGYFSVPTGTGTIFYAGQHATRDWLGGTGGGVLITQGNTATRTRALNNIAQACTAGDIVRIEKLFYLPANPGTAGRANIIMPLAVSGSIPAGALYIDFDTAGNCTFGGTGMRFGGDRVDTINGRPAYFAFWEGRFAATGTIAPQMREPDTVIAGGWSIFVQEMRIIKNPQTRLPSAAPVLAVDKTFTRDRPNPGGDMKVSYKMLRMRRGRSSVAISEIGGIGSYMSGPEVDRYLHYERKIVVSPATEGTNHDFILPNPNQDLDFKPLYQGADVTVYLAPRCYFNQVLEQPVTAQTTGVLAVRGVDRRAQERPLVYKVNSNAVRLATLNISDIGVFTRSSTVATQLGQSGILDLNIIGASTTIDQVRCLFASHTKFHSRAVSETFFGEEAGIVEVQYVGRNRYNTLNPAGATLAIKESVYYRCGRAIQIDSSAQINPLTLDVDGIRFQEIYSDAVVLGRGLLLGTWRNTLLWKLTALDQDFYQMRDEVEIDVGGGRVPFSASGLAALPNDRAFTLFSKRDGGGQPIDTSQAARLLWTENKQTLRVPNWIGAAGSAFNKPGFQMHTERYLRRRGWTSTLHTIGKYFDTFPDLVAATGYADGDQAYVYSGALIGGVLTNNMTLQHLDPFSGAMVRDQGAYKFLSGYGWCRIADATPAHSATTYASMAALVAAEATPGAYSRGIIAAGDPDAGVYEKMPNPGVWTKIADVITLPVWASTPGAPSPSNPHIYLTADAIRWTSAIATITLNGDPSSSASATHGDFMQENVTTVDNRLKCSFNVLLAEAQGFFWQQNSGANRSFTPDGEIFKNIIMTRLPNIITVTNPRPGDIVNVHDNIGIFSNTVFKPRSGTAPTAQFLIQGTAATVTASNNWIAAPEGNLSGTNVSGGGLISENPKSINAPATTNFEDVSTPRRLLGTPISTDIFATGSGDQYGFADLTQDPRTIVFNPGLEATIGIPLNDIMKSCLAGSQWSTDVDVLLARIATMQRRPDYVFTVAAGTAVGTTIATGLKSASFHEELGGAELGHFTLESGTLRTAKALTGLNQRLLLVGSAGELIDIDTQ